jgi:DNA-binding XRE family transcriptional regulator
MIYLISHEDKFLKIGYTCNINNRLSQLQTSNPIRLKVINLIKGDVNLEKELHSRFKDIRVNGEWFVYDAEILNYFSNQDSLMWKYGFTPYEKMPIIGLIKTERLNRNMPMATLGELYGCSAQSIHEIEVREMQGKLTLNILHKMAKIFNKKLEYRFVSE